MQSVAKQLFRVFLFFASLQVASTLRLLNSYDDDDDASSNHGRDSMSTAWAPLCPGKELNATNHRHVLFAGDSYCRFMALAMIEHLGGNGFCDVPGSPESCQKETKYKDGQECLQYRRQWCGMREENNNFGPLGQVPNHNKPIQYTFCHTEAVKINIAKPTTITAIEMWDNGQLKTMLPGMLDHFRPDILVASYMRSTTLDFFPNDADYEKWLQGWADLAKAQKLKLIWVGNHERCMEKVPENFKEQSNIIATRRNAIARKVMKENGFQMLDPVEQNGLTEAAVCQDTADGTHVGMKGNIKKVESLVKIGVLGDQ